MTYIPDMTILGGGIIGLLTAKEFVDAGYRVTIIDKSFSGQESSWAGGGILLPLYPWRQPEAISKLVVESIKQYPFLATELIDAIQVDPEWYDCGLLICKNPDIEMAVDWCNKYKILYDKASHSFFDHLKTQTKNPLWLPNIAQARNPRLLKSLKAYLISTGTLFIENCDVTCCEVDNDKVTGLSTNQGDFRINQLIIAAGAWTTQLLERLLPRKNYPKILPVKGQMLLFDATLASLDYMVLDGDHYLIPRKDGKILVGSSVEHCGFDKNITADTKDKLYTFATELCPRLKNFPLINHWAGLRPGTVEGVPYICKHPEIKNLSINAGHFRNGLVMGPASAKLMADLVLDRQTSINPEPYKL